MKKLLLLFFFLAVVSCKENTSLEKIPVEQDNGIGDGAGPPPVLSFSENIEEAHNKPAFMMQEAVSFNIYLKFGGETRLNGKVSMTTNSSRVRLDKSDGTTLIYNGENLYISPDSTQAEGARFDIFTWQYFFAMPFKLTDPGTVWEVQKSRILDSIKYETAKLSFKPNIGDSPDDWYIVYKDPETNRLKAAAYIVTYGREKEKAEENPHAIVYSAYQMIDDVAIATTWSFHNWNEKDGIGEKLGEAKLSDIRFFDAEKDFFKAPDDSRKITEKGN